MDSFDSDLLKFRPIIPDNSNNVSIESFPMSVVNVSDSHVLPVQKTASKSPPSEARNLLGGSDRSVIRIGLNAVENRLKQFGSQTDLIVRACEIDKIQQATDTYTRLLELKQEKLKTAISLSRPDENRCFDSGSSSKVIETPRACGVHIHDYLDDIRVPMSPILPHRSTSISFSSGSSIVRLNGQQKDRLGIYGTRLRRQLNENQHSIETLSENNIERNQLPKLGISSINTWPAGKNNSRRIEPVVVSRNESVDVATKTTAEVEARKKASEWLKRRLNEFRDQVQKMTRQQTEYYDRASSPVHKFDPLPIRQLNQKRALPVVDIESVMHGNTPLKPLPFISAKFPGTTSHSIHTNMQELLAALKQQHSTLHQIALHQGQLTTVPRLAQAFRNELQRLLIVEEQHLVQLLHKFDTLCSVGGRESRLEEKDRMVFEIELQDSSIQRLQEQLKRLESSLCKDAMDRNCKHLIRVARSAKTRHSDHTICSMLKSTNQQAIVSSDGRQLRQLRLLRSVFLP